MPFPWVIVGGTGFDVEDVLDPQTKDMVCPSCEKNVRFTEKVLVKNLRVFGIALVGVEKGRRVFQCPHCGVCVEPPAGEAAQPERGQERAVEGPSLEGLEKRLERARDEQWLWKQRMELADRSGDAELYTEAQKRLERAQREAARAEAELGRARELRAQAQSGAASVGKSAQGGAKPVVVARAGESGGFEPSVDSEFAALKARLARKAAEEEQAQRAQVSASEGAEEREQASAPAQASAASGPAASEQEPAVGRGEEGDAGETGGEDEVDQEFAALKARLAAGPAAPRDSGAYETLKREVREAGTTDGPSTSVNAASVMGATTSGASTAASGASATGDGDDEDPAAALKRKLRKR
jgi:hypothetical protein